MTGKEAIINKIISDARIKANSSLEEGGIKAKEILDVARNDARIFKEKNIGYKLFCAAVIVAGIVISVL